MKKVTVVITAIFMILFLLAAVSANLTASISKPRMVLYENITGSGKITFENSVGVINNNNHSVMINIEPAGAWKGRVNISEPQFILEAGEKKDVNYTITIEKAGYYSGEIGVTFSENDSKNTLDMPQKLVVIVKDKNGKVPGEITLPYTEESSRDWSNAYLWICAGAVLIVILLFFIIKIANKKNEKQI